MHIKRVIAAFVFIPLLLLLVLKGSYLHYSLFISTLSLMGLLEYFKLIKGKVNHRMRITGVLWGMFLAAGLFIGNSQIVIAILALGFISLCLTRLSITGDIKTVFQDIGFTSLGPLYVSLLFGHLQLIQTMVEGRKWTLLLFATIWMGDTAAFYTGLSVGRHKLYPEISPNKTVEGAAGGVFGSIIVVVIAKMWFIRQMSLTDVAVISIGIAVVGQLGDLCESMFKRAAGVKDSGSIIPGHGGILDRFDSILFAAPFLYYYLTSVKCLY